MSELAVKAKTLDEFLTNFKSELELVGDDKVKCLVTNHELPKKLDLLKAHWQGKAYKKALRKRKFEKDIDLTQYEPFIVPHKFNKHQLFCRLTKKDLNKDAEDILRHVSGRRYKRKLAELKTREEKRAARAKKLAEQGKDPAAAHSSDDDIFDDEDGIIANDPTAADEPRPTFQFSPDELVKDFGFDEVPSEWKENGDDVEVVTEQPKKADEKEEDSPSNHMSIPVRGSDDESDKPQKNAPKRKRQQPRKPGKTGKTNHKPKKQKTKSTTKPK